MATHGERQLLRLTLSYCNNGGSSRFVRELLATNQLVSFANANPELEIKTEIKKNAHPFIRGEYKTGWDKTIGCKNLDNATLLKNMNMLNDSSGRKITKITKNVFSDKPSVQGAWTPSLNLHEKVEFDIKEVR